MLLLFGACMLQLERDLAEKSRNNRLFLVVNSSHASFYERLHVLEDFLLAGASLCHQLGQSLIYGLTIGIQYNCEESGIIRECLRPPDVH